MHDSEEEGSDAASGGEDNSADESDAVEDAHLLEDSSAGGSDAESLDDDVSDEDAPARGRSKANAPTKRAPAASSSKAKATSAAASKAKSTSSAAGRSAASSSKVGKSANTAVEVVDLDEDEEYDDPRYSAGKSSAKAKAAPSSGATAGGSAASRGAAEVINIDGEDDIVDDDGFMRSAAPASASLKSVATATQQSSLRLPGGTVGRKRQLPLSFSQAPPSQAGGARKPASNKSLASGWDE